MTNICETERLYLRLFTIDDELALAPILGDKEVMHFSSTGVLSLDGIKRYLQDQLLRS